MTAALRVIDTGAAPGRWNVAATAALAGTRERNPDGPDVLRFHRYEPCALLGRGQRLAEAADLYACQRLGVAVARRVTGGGAVYMAPAILAFDLICRRQASRLGATMAAAAAAVAAALRGLGLAPEVQGTDAVLLGGAKVSGLSGSFRGPVVTIQASLLVDADRRTLEAVLAPQLAAHGAGPATTTLRDRLGHAPPHEAIAAAIVAALAPAWDRVGRDAMTADETALAGDLLADLGSDAFVLGGETLAGAA